MSFFQKLKQKQIFSHFSNKNKKTIENVASIRPLETSTLKSSNYINDSTIDQTKQTFMNRNHETLYNLIVYHIDSETEGTFNLTIKVNINQIKKIFFFYLNLIFVIE
jgi:hypothetical protein